MLPCAENGACDLIAGARVVVCALLDELPLEHALAIVASVAMMIVARRPRIGCKVVRCCPSPRSARRPEPSFQHLEARRHFMEWDLLARAIDEGVPGVPK